MGKRLLLPRILQMFAPRGPPEACLRRKLNPGTAPRTRGIASMAPVLIEQPARPNNSVGGTMKSIRLLALSVCLAVALIQDPVQKSNLFAQSELDPTLLGSGSFTLETAGLDKGSRISLETDLQ